MKNVLVLVHDDVGQDARLQAAFDLTRSLSGHLTCLDLTIPYLPLSSVDFIYEDTAVIDREAESANGARVRARVTASGLPFTWIERTDSISRALIEDRDLADVIVLSSPGDLSTPDMRTAIGTALVECGKSVLVVPDSAAGMTVSGQAVLAWDGSREASAAMHAALPLLRRAAAVTILEINDGSLKTPAGEAAAYLRQHDVAVEVRGALTFGEKVGFLLLDQIELLKADYLVMGGYGHPRIVEDVFGGVTERMLCDSPVPVFLKH